MATNTLNKYKLMIISDPEYLEIERLYQEQAHDSGYSQARLSIKYRVGERTRSLAVVAFRKGNDITLGEANVINLLQTEVGSLSHDQIPNLDNVIRAHLRGKNTQILKFSSETSKVIYYPLNASTAAGIIMAFYNGSLDPFDRINTLRLDESATEPLLVLYYLSCIKYITDIDLCELLTEEDGFQAAADETAIVPISERTLYRELKKTERPIPANHICLHALFGAYVLCRPVASKLDFGNWIKKRYSSLVSSMHQTADPRDNFQLQKGGNVINRISSVRPSLKRIVYNLMQGEYEETRAQALKTHSKMLTALSEMTTFSLINRVINVGKSVIALRPLPDQLITYAKERREIISELEKGGYPEEDIVYIHLIHPNKQCFVSSKYPDLIVAAMAIEKFLDPKTKTIENYREKTQNAILNETQIVQFLRHQSSESVMGTMSDEQMSVLGAELGINMEPLIREAKKVLDLMNKQAM